MSKHAEALADVIVNAVDETLKEHGYRGVDTKEDKQEAVAKFTTIVDAVYGPVVEAAKAAILYDAAIQSCANDPKRMTEFLTAQGDDLDALYDNWIGKSRAALATLTPAEKGKE